jgi:hypothetical protein
LARILTALVKTCAQHAGLVNSATVLLVALGVSHEGNVDFLKEVWIEPAAIFEIPEADYREYIAGCRNLGVAIKGNWGDSRHRRIQPHDHEVVLIIWARAVVWVLDALYNSARLSAACGKAGLIGTHDDTCWDAVWVAVGGGQDNVRMDETSPTALVYPLDEVRIFSLGSLVSADDAIGQDPNRVIFLCVFDSSFFADMEVLLVAWNRFLSGNGCKEYGDNGVVAKGKWKHGAMFGRPRIVRQDLIVRPCPLRRDCCVSECLLMSCWSM